MKIRCDYNEIGGPIDKIVEEVSYVDPKYGKSSLRIKEVNTLIKKSPSGLTYEDKSFCFKDFTGNIVEAFIDAEKMNFKIKGKNANSVNIVSENGYFYQVKLVKVKTKTKFKIIKIDANDLKMQDFVHSVAVYSNTADSLHRLQLAPLIGHGKGALGLTGKGVKVAILDNDFVIKNDRVIKDKALPGGRVFGGEHGVLEALDFGGKGSAHGSNQARVLLGELANKRIGVAPGAQFMPVVSLGTQSLVAKSLADNFGVKIFSCSLWSMTFNDIYLDANIGDNLEGKLMIVVAGNGKGKNTTLENNLPLDRTILDRMIVSVALDERGNLTKASSKCGGTKDFCIGVPALSPTSPTAPTIAAVVALLQEAFPKATLLEIRKAILKGVDELGGPKESTGVGMLNAYKAYVKLSQIMHHR